MYAQFYDYYRVTRSYNNPRNVFCVFGRMFYTAGGEHYDVS